jgi:hypothetical protein
MQIGLKGEHVYHGFCGDHRMLVLSRLPSEAMYFSSTKAALGYMDYQEAGLNYSRY